MACNSCKNKQGTSELLNSLKQGNEEQKPRDFGFILFDISIRIILFFISLTLIPIILVFVVYLLFKTIILNRGDVNLMPPLLALANKIGIGKKRVEEEYPEDYEDLNSDNPDEYELVERVDKVEI